MTEESLPGTPAPSSSGPPLEPVSGTPAPSSSGIPASDDGAAGPLLTIAYSSLAERAGDVVWPERSDDLDLLLCVQGDLPEGFVPPEGVRLVRVPGRGVAKSRNASLRHARGRYLLFCDDDVRVDLDGVCRGVEHLRATGKAIALGRGMGADGELRKRYAAEVTPLTLFNSAKAATYEMLVDVDRLRAHDVWFDERFGAGAELYLGDEYILIADLLRAGLAGDAVPFVYGIHPVESSGSRWGGRDAHARAVVFNRIFGWQAPPIRLAFAVRSRDKLGGWGAVARFALNGTRPPAA
ncbi:glycosyltransferase family 2 protein [Myceligenerans pegani]|uniref:Glycosyltransferase n=1 Tax=Myceligenerans pegani TaxID=2776917 RepID=A0ABR9MYB3_9MICO|nr:glycosyltransferase [Myceligenerans sp. TRM 65318]MBE1876362.1 glycosyltransferase [Myceligenerans sp. TRM 65318]MBE3018633.1 glycosyltransferase [Myceligenerans sp. TRM 65318]